MLIICDFALKYSLNVQQVTKYFSTILSQLPLLKGAARLERKSFFLRLEKLWQKKDWERKAEKAAQIILKNYF